MRPQLFAVPPVLLLLAGCSPERDTTSSDAFARQALTALPVEEPYDFNRALTEGREPQWRRDPDAWPGPDEMALPSAGWTLLLDEDASPVPRLAARQFRDYLGATLETEIAIDSRPSLADWSDLRDTIVAGTGDQLAGCADSLKAPKDYRLTISPSRIVVCGFDAAGAAYGLYNLEARMKLREAPILPAKLDTVRHSLYQARFTLSGLGWMEWPDPYLALLPRYGFDSIFASVYLNPNGVSGVPPGGVGRFPPYWDKWKEGQQTPARMHDLIDRAARFGLDVYGQIIFLYTGEPGFDEAALRKLVRDLVTEFPEIRGYILLTEGFAYETWFGAGGKTGVDLLDWAGNWVRLVNIVTEECHRLNPDVEILVWEYNVPFRPDFADVKAQITGMLPASTIPLLTFENGKSFELDGHRSHLRDYSISQAGPAEVTEAQIAVAKKRGMRAVYSKADTWASWQFGTFPYIPAPYQWHARYEALEEHGIDGTLESWSYGFKPNFVAEMRAWYSWSDAPPLDDLLRQMARREFGAGSEELVLAAWEHFSRAVRLVPGTGPRWGTNNAVAAPFFFDKPTRPRAMTVEHSWYGQENWKRTSRLNPYWPYLWHNMFLWPDFTNQTNVAERYTRPFPLPVFMKYQKLAADELEKGLRLYRQAALAAPEQKQPRAFREVLLVEQMQRMLRSAHALLEFEDLRFHLSEHEGPEPQLDRMAQILAEEITRTEASWETARRDSRLGYEWEMDYMYTPDVLQEKLELLRLTLDKQLPAYRTARRR